jgi:poly [ADP-ribose] polymerase
VLESDADPKKYYFFTRWGRVGVRGQVAQMGPWTMEECIHQYTAKIKEKSVKGDYRVIEKDYLPP